VDLARGEFFASFGMNPLVSLCFIIAALAFFYSLITLIVGIPRVGVILSDQEKNIVRSGTVALILANWCYLIISR
jgi:fumarate reductase subunit C